jgi:hypothetical protein
VNFLPGVVRRHFGPFAGNPNRQPEIQKNRWNSPKSSGTFLLVREVSNLPLNF